MWWLLAACVSCLFFSTAVLGTFVPLQNPGGVEYVFAAPPAATALTAWLLCACVLVTVFFAVRALARAQSPQHLAEAHSGRWLAPVAALGIVFFGILPAVPGVGEQGSVVGYFLYDLRWWWAIVLMALALGRADRLVGAPFGRSARGISGWSPGARLLLLDTLLFVGVVAWAVNTAPNGLFDNSLVGDEPKYLRYDEVWYQGRGLDISSLTLIRDQPLDARPALLQNGALLISAIPQELGAFAKDLRDFAREPSRFTWNRASGAGGFVSGIHGGLYEQYAPGTSAVLFPGYFIDRYLLNVNSSKDGKWPADFPTTNLMMLLTYGICSVVLFRLLRNALESEILAWIWAAVAMLTLPTSAFAFQLYPELPALLIILAVSNELLFAGRSRLLAAAVAGMAAGALGWFHVRFLLVSLCLAAVAWFAKTGRARWAFQVTFGLLVFSMMMFNYHVTGSWWPTSLWDANGEGVAFDNIDFALNSIGYALDSRWGLVPHSLLLVGALPGLLVLGRKSLRHAVFVAVVVLGLVAVSAGHTLVAAGTTPDRLVVAVTPLLMWPVAVLVARFWSSQVVRIATVVLGVLSLDAGRAYNWSHTKQLGLLRDVSLSGWKPNLAFPDIRGETWEVSQANFLLFLCMVVLILALSWLAFVSAGRIKIRLKPNPTQNPAPGGDPRSTWDPALAGFALSGLVVATLIVGFSAATSANEDWTHPLYLLEDATARSAVVRAVVDSDRCVCFTSARGHIDWTSVKPNSARSALVDMFPDGLHLTVLVLAQGDGKDPAFGRTRVEFGDGEETAWDGVLTERRIAHTYRQSGTYPVKVWFQLPARVSPQLHRQTVEVHATN